MKILDCCGQSQGNNDGSKRPALLVWVISSEPQRLWSQNLLLPWIIIRWRVMCKNWVAIFKVKATVRAHNFLSLKYDCFHYVFWTTAPFVTKHSLMMDHHKPWEKMGLLCSVSRSQWRLNIWISVSRQNFLNCWPPPFVIFFFFCTKLSMMSHMFIWEDCFSVL